MLLARVVVLAVVAVVLAVLLVLEVLEHALAGPRRLRIALGSAALLGVLWATIDAALFLG